MPAPWSPRSRALVAGIALLALGATGAVGACASTISSTAPDPATKSGTVPMADVVAKLPSMVVHGNKAAEDDQAGAYDDAKDEAGRIDEIWKPLAATVKAAAPGSYAQIVDAQRLLHTAATRHDMTALEQAAAQQSTAVSAFLAAHH